MYLAVFLAGIALALATRAFWGHPRHRGCFIPVALTLLSAAIAAASRAIVVERSALFDPALTIPLAVILLGSFIATRFPRAIGFPLIIAFGAALSFVSCFLLPLPLAKESQPIGYLRFEPDGSARVRFPLSQRGAGWGLFYPIPDQDSAVPIALEAISITFDPRWPLLGGCTHAALVSVSRGPDSSLSVSPASFVASPRFFFPGVHIRLHSLIYTPPPEAQGLRIPIFLRGEGLILEP